MPFERYADDGIVHCRTLEDANELRDDLVRRFGEWKLELTPAKTNIVNCKENDRKGTYPMKFFDFLEYTFRLRRSKDRNGTMFVGFLPAVSNESKRKMRQTIHDWRMLLRPDIDLEDLSRMYNPVIRGCVNYYVQFYKSEIYPVLRQINRSLVRWSMRKYRQFARHENRARDWLDSNARLDSMLFVQWQMSVYP